MSSGQIAGVFAIFIMVAYVGFLTYKVWELPLAIIAVATIVMAAIDLWQTEFERRQGSRRS